MPEQLATCNISRRTPKDHNLSLETALSPRLQYLHILHEASPFYCHLYAPSCHTFLSTSTTSTAIMAYNNQYGYQSPPPGAAQNLQFYPSSYGTGPVSGHTTPFQASTGYGSPPAGGAPAYGNYGGAPAAFGGQMGNVSGRMGEQMGLRTGWLAAFGTEGYEHEPGLMQELGVNFGHIKTKVRVNGQKVTLFFPIH